MFVVTWKIILPSQTFDISSVSFESELHFFCHDLSVFQIFFRKIVRAMDKRMEKCFIVIHLCFRHTEHSLSVDSNTCYFSEFLMRTWISHMFLCLLYLSPIFSQDLSDMQLDGFYRSFPFPCYYFLLKTLYLLKKFRYLLSSLFVSSFVFLICKSCKLL